MSRRKAANPIHQPPSKQAGAGSHVFAKVSAEELVRGGFVQSERLGDLVRYLEARRAFTDAFGTNSWWQSRLEEVHQSINSSQDTVRSLTGRIGVDPVEELSRGLRGARERVMQPLEVVLNDQADQLTEIRSGFDRADALLRRLRDGVEEVRRAAHSINGPLQQVDEVAQELRAELESSDARLRKVKMEFDGQSSG